MAADPPPPECTFCRAKLQNVEALRAALPDDWNIRSERDPVFGGEVLVVQAGASDAQVLVLVHGLGQNGFTDWLSVMPALAREYRVIAFDLPGFGYSDAPSGKYSPTNYAAVLDAVLARHAPKAKVRLVGHSLGGAVALRYAGTHPARISQLVLVDAAGILERTAFVKSLASLPVKADDAPLPLKRAVSWLQGKSNKVVEWATKLPDPTRILSADEALWGGVLGSRTTANAALALAEEDFSAIAHELDVPVHLIWGEKDSIAPLRTGIALAGSLPRAQLHTLPGAGHAPMNEAAAVSQFLPVLEQALLMPPQRLPPPAVDFTSHKDLQCKNKSGVTYSGAFREVRIQNCAAVKLVDLSAQRLIVRDSRIELENVRIQSTDIGLKVKDSEVIASGGVIHAETAVHTRDSHLDFAGFVIETQGAAFDVASQSQLTGSLTKIRAKGYSGYWNDSRKVKKGMLPKQ